MNLISETHGIMISIKDHIEFYDSICSSGFVECQVNGAGVIFITLFSICIQYSIILPFIDESIHWEMIQNDLQEANYKKKPYGIEIMFSF